MKKYTIISLLFLSFLLVSITQVHAKTASSLELFEIFKAFGVIPVDKVGLAKDILTEQGILVSPLNIVPIATSTNIITTSVTATSACHTFAKNIGTGARGSEYSDLYFLRKILEKEGFSIGKYDTTDYGFVFNIPTFLAVKDFQEKYASEILAPYKLTRGTGFVGIYTRAKLNQLYGCKIKTGQIPLTASSTIATSSVSVYPIFSGGGGGGGGSNTASVINAVKEDTTTASSRSLKVLYPTNSLGAPTSNLISWESTGITRVKIEACWNGNTECAVIANPIAITASPETYMWFIETNAPYVGKDDVVIKISDLDSSVFDYLDKQIRIILTQVPRSLQVQNFTNSLIAPISNNIFWESTGITRVKIEACWNNNVECSTIAGSVAVATSSEIYFWVIRTNEPYVGKDDVVIKISDLDSAVFDYQDNGIKIIPTPPKPFLKVIEPINSFGVPSLVRIMWESTGVTRVKIEACWNGNAECEVIANPVAVTTSPEKYMWYIETNAPYVGKDDVVIKVSDLDSAVFDYLDNPVKIVSTN